MTPEERDTLGQRVEAAQSRYLLTNRVTAMALFCIAAYFGLERLGLGGIALVGGAALLGCTVGWAVIAGMNRMGGAK